MKITLLIVNLWILPFTIFRIDMFHIFFGHELYQIAVQKEGVASRLQWEAVSGESAHRPRFNEAAGERAILQQFLMETEEIKRYSGTAGTLRTVENGWN